VIGYQIEQHETPGVKRPRCFEFWVADKLISHVIGRCVVVCKVALGVSQGERWVDGDIRLVGR
jgi:hypothetical protein